MCFHLTPTFSQCWCRYWQRRRCHWKRKHIPYPPTWTIVKGPPPGYRSTMTVSGWLRLRSLSLNTCTSMSSVNVPAKSVGKLGSVLMARESSVWLWLSRRMRVSLLSLWKLVRVLLENDETCWEKSCRSVYFLLVR